MIGFIRGEIIFSDLDYILIFSNGIGWEVNVFDTTKYVLKKEEDIYCYTHFSQDKTTIWGVSSMDELIMLRKLISVSGVGPRTALTLIGNKGLDEISHAIEEGDLVALKVKGLGQKTLQKIIIELKGKLDLSNKFIPSLSRKLDDIMQALVELGYIKSDIISYFESKGNEYFKDLEEKDIIKQFLKEYK